MLNETLGRRLRQERERRGLTLTALAKRVHTSVSFLSDIEHGRTMPSVQTLRSIAEALNVSVDYLLEPGAPGEPEQGASASGVEPKLVGERLRTARQRLGLKQKEAAARAGIRNEMLCRYEKGASMPPYPVLTRLATLYGVSVDYLVGKQPTYAGAIPWWDRDEPPTEVELLEFIQQHNNLRLMGNPLDERAKEDVLLALRVIWQHMQEQKKRARESEKESGRGKEPTPENA